MTRDARKPDLKALAEAQLDETILVARLRAGDMIAARMLYDTHADRVYRLIYRLVGESSLAEDCMQDTFIRVFQRIGDYRGGAPLGSWIRKVATSVTLNALRSTGSRGREVELTELETHAPSEQGDPDVRARLKQAIDALPDPLRVVFIMYDVEGYSHREIGDALGVKEGVSKVRLWRARALLRGALADFAEWREA